MKEFRNLQEDEFVPGTDAQVLRNTFMVYGSLLIIIFVLFCWIRKRFPRPYTLRQWVDDLKTEIADSQHGYFSWMWQLNNVTEDEILSECGLDALCYLRLIRMGFKIAFLCCLNAIWLMPLYALAPHDVSEDDGTNSTGVDDIETNRVTKLTTANVPDGSPRLVGTVVAAYILFFYVIFLILKEFEWFIEKRHKLLKSPEPANYAVYVRNVPKEFRSNNRLDKYFQYCLPGDNVLETRLRIKAPALQKAVQKRDDYVTKLEHALNYERIKSENPTHREMNLLTGKFQTVDSIPYYSEKLREANADVKQRIEEIEGMITTPRVPEIESTALDLGSGTWDNEEIEFAEQAQPLASGPSHESGNSGEADALETDENEGEVKRDGFFGFKLLSTATKAATKATKEVANVATTATKGATNIAATGVKAGMSGVTNVANAATNLLHTNEGEYHSAGFVTFKTLGTKNAAIQMVHYAKPFGIEVMEAPRPDDIFWSNVGREHKSLQIGNLLSLGATVALCFFWTIPMASIAALSSVEGLRKEFEWIDDMINKAPFMKDVLTVLAPLLVKIANALLPIILERLTMFEGPVSSSVVEASLFTKLAAFMIIQTFFVSAIGGGVMNELSAIIDNPSSFISLLAKSLPEQSTYFTQIVFVGMVVSLGMEMLRVIPLILALVRRFVGPNLTEKERRSTFFGIRPLADPLEFEHADNLSNLVFCFIVMLVYAVIAPMTAFIQAFCFFFMHICYRHQFVFIYPKHPDSGGKVWSNFVKVLLSCLLIAQFTVAGLLALKKAAIAVPLMTPLIVITILFNAYIRQEHFRVAEYLPSRECMKVDLNHDRDFVASFAEGAYLQDELQEKVRLPENLEDERAQILKLDQLSTVELTAPADEPSEQDVLLN